LFLSERYGKCLLILDDVWSTTIIQAFSVCGRVLVTTQDVSIMDGVSANQHMVVAVHMGFTEEESMQVGSKSDALSNLIPCLVYIKHEQD
jgi:hypothetical protein